MRALTIVGAAVMLGACALPVESQSPSAAPAKAAAPAASAVSTGDTPGPECLGVLDTLASGIPKEEGLPELKRKGVRLVAPLLPTGVQSAGTSRGVLVRMQVDVDGRPVPGSARVVKTQGGDGLTPAVEAAVANMVFDLTNATGLKYPFTFSTAYVSCASK